MSKEIGGGRRKGGREELLSRAVLGPDPIPVFSRWFEEARASSVMEYPNAACLSTVDDGGWPQGRIVLLKGFDERGFIFFTNYRSAKGKALERHPRAALTFYWHDLDRQVRIRGEVERIPAEESDAYFRTRPRGSQVGAWASSQSEPSGTRERLVDRAREVEERFGEEEIPRPPHWGGFVIRPVEVEFWQGAPSRLHDRIVYRSDRDGTWETQRLDP